MLDTVFTFSLAISGDPDECWRGLREVLEAMPSVITVSLPATNATVADVNVRVQASDAAAARKLHDRMVRVIQKRRDLQLLGISYDLRALTGRL